jgi:predicted HNH restriction endonuclease
MKHFRIERNQGVVKQKKEQFQREHGFLQCEVCSFRYNEHYPKDLAEGFIEAHHIKPLADLDEATRTIVKDLILVCANCHRMVHRTKDVEENLERLRRHLGEVV